MTREDIIRMAREAGFEIDCCSLEWHDRIERFAALVAAAEREACARVCHAEATIAVHAKRLALDLECLLLSCNDTAAVSRWWDSAHEALANYRADLYRLYLPDDMRRASSEAVGL